MDTTTVHIKVDLQAAEQLNRREPISLGLQILAWLLTAAPTAHTSPVLSVSVRESETNLLSGDNRVMHDLVMTGAGGAEVRYEAARTATVSMSSVTIGSCVQNR